MIDKSCTSFKWVTTTIAFVWFSRAFHFYAYFCSRILLSWIHTSKNYVAVGPSSLVAKLRALFPKYFLDSDNRKHFCNLGSKLMGKQTILEMQFLLSVQRTKSLLYQKGHSPKGLSGFILLWSVCLMSLDIMKLLYLVSFLGILIRILLL